MDVRQTEKKKATLTHATQDQAWGCGFWGTEGHVGGRGRLKTSSPVGTAGSCLHMVTPFLVQSSL